MDMCKLQALLLTLPHLTPFTPTHHDPQNGTCRSGYTCLYAHGPLESRLHPYK